MNKKSQIDFRVLIAAIAGLVVIECFAMTHGVNGTFRMIITVIIAGIAGIAIPTEKFIKK